MNNNPTYIVQNRGEIIKYKPGDYNDGVNYYQNFVYTPDEIVKPEHHKIITCDNNWKIDGGVGSCNDQYGLLYGYHDATNKAQKNIWRLNIDFERYRYLELGSYDIFNPVYIFMAQDVKEFILNNEFKIENIGIAENNYSKFRVVRYAYAGNLNYCCLNKTLTDTDGNTCEPILRSGPECPKCNTIYKNYCIKNFGEKQCKKFALDNVNNQDVANSFDQLAIDYCNSSESTSLGYDKSKPITSQNWRDSYCTCMDDVPVDNMDGFSTDTINYLKNPKCWNNNCILYGYMKKAQIDFNCPSLDICNNLVNISSKDNIAIGLTQTCGNIKEVPEDDIVPKSPVDVPDYTFIYLILFFILFLIICFVVYMFRNRSRNE